MADTHRNARIDDGCRDQDRDRAHDQDCRLKRSPQHRDRISRRPESDWADDSAQDGTPSGAAQSGQRGRPFASAALDFEQRFRGELTGLLVQQMVTEGVEMLVGAVHDPTFGPLVVCGSGGVLVDLLADSAFRIHPLTTEDAAEMIRDVRGARLLRGYRGAPPADEAALRDVVLRVSALLSICPEIQELDLNPVRC